MFKMERLVVIILVMVGIAALALGIQEVRGDESPTGPASTGHSEPTEEDADMAKATFGAGCFWGVEAAFRKTPGVTSTQVGFMGGSVENPTYKQVCYEDTGHAEVVEVTYDPEQVSYESLLKTFWDVHDPTQVNRQGPDVGDQYRTVIFYHTPEQKEAAEQSKAELEESGKYSRPIATQIEPAEEFYRAEEYHQQYLEKKGLASCKI
jgi:peptide-methionine (S)-S-oxide reductase